MDVVLQRSETLKMPKLCPFALKSRGTLLVRDLQ
jgi:hypothetical protein